MKNIVKNLSLRTQSVLKRGTVAMLCTILIGAGTLTFHSCKKDEVNKISKKEQITQRHLIQKKIIEIDRIITSTDGVQYRIKGWVDIRPLLGWPLLKYSVGI